LKQFSSFAKQLDQFRHSRTAVALIILDLGQLHYEDMDLRGQQVLLQYLKYHLQDIWLKLMSYIHCMRQVELELSVDPHSNAIVLAAIHFLKEMVKYCLLQAEHTLVVDIDPIEPTYLESSIHYMMQSKLMYAS